MDTVNSIKNLPSIIPVGYLKDSLKEVRTNGLPHGYDTGVSNLDDIFRADKGRLMTITGIPNCGKSEFVDFYTVSLNKKYGFKPAYYSPEKQPYAFHLAQLIPKFTNKPLDESSPEEIDKALEHICNNFFFFNYEKVKTFGDIEKHIEYLVTTVGIDILVIDAYNKVESDKPTGETETEFIGKFLDKLCELAIKHNILIILVAHPKKMDWKRNDKVAQRPTAYDINGSAHFFNKSDFVLCVHRDRDEENEMVIIDVDKVKFNHYGNQGRCLLKYDLASGNYYNAPANKWSRVDGDSKCEYKTIPFSLDPLPKVKDPLDVTVTWYANKYDNIGSEVCLRDFLLTDRYKDIAEIVRRGQTPKERKDIKDELVEAREISAATISGTFTQRGNDFLDCASGLICIDIDLKDNDSEIMATVPSILKQLPYVAFFEKSISGDGYMAVIPITNPHHLRQHYFALEQEMKSYGIILDKNCKDIARLRYASYDPERYYNPNATTYYWEVDLPHPPKDKQTEGKKNEYHVTSTSSELDKIKREIEYMKNQNIVFPDDYDTWKTIGMALNTGLGEDGREIFHEISKLSDKYDELECDNQYDAFRRTYENGCDVTLGSLFHIIKEAKENKFNS